MKYDVVVVGSGGAGLAAALAAATGGCSVVVLERSGLFGGTSAMSGGSLWIPNNRRMRALGMADSREEALEYLRHLSLGRVADVLLEAYVDGCNGLIAFLEEHTGLEFEANATHPDYQPELPGAKLAGRTLHPSLYDSRRLGEQQAALRAGPISLPLTQEDLEAIRKRTTSDSVDWDFGMVAKRMEQGIVGLGRALVGELMEACVRRGVTLVSNARATVLQREGARVRGVLAERNGEPERFEAGLGVVLASGGFEWNRTLIERFLGVPLDAPSSVPTNEGDGLSMAMAAGAALGNMTEAWWAPSLTIPGETYEGVQTHRYTTDLRSLPGSIVVNSRGRRFMNEAVNYSDAPRAMMHFDPASYTYANLPCFLILDAQFRRSYSIATISPSRRTPSWLAEEPTLRALAARLGIDPDGLEVEVEAFNRHAMERHDPAFHRGEGLYDRYGGDTRVQPNPSLRPLGEGPYYGVELKIGALGTKGGPLTDEHAQVLDAYGRLIPGLFAAGNAAASVFGPGCPGAGAALGSALTFGYLAGSALAAQRATEVAHA